MKSNQLILIQKKKQTNKVQINKQEVQESKELLENVMRDTTRYTEYGGRIKIKALCVVYALKWQGRTVSVSAVKKIIFSPGLFKGHL